MCKYLLPGYLVFLFKLIIHIHVDHSMFHSNGKSKEEDKDQESIQSKT